MNAWLKHQQCRFMRPDGGRYVRPDIGRYFTPEQKWDGQPRIEKDEEGAGRFTFGTQDDEEPSGGDRPRVYIDTPRSGDGSDSDGNSDGDPDDFFVLASGSVGPGHNNGPPFGDPPEIPETRPSNSSSRTAFMRAAAQWIGAAVGAGALIPTAIFIGALNNVEWLNQYNSSIESYRDPPRTLEDLQASAGQKRPGYEDHHIIEQTAAQKWGLTRSEINDKSNVVSIPRLKHYQITGWFQRANPQFGGLSPRQYLSDKGITERREVGLYALELFKVLK